MATPRTSGSPPTTPTDDPRLTAYALGEVSAIERRDVEATLEADPSLGSEVDAIRAVAASLATALAAETEAAAAPALTVAQRAAVVEAATRSKPAVQISFGSGVRRFRLFSTAGAVVVLAGIAMLFVGPYVLMSVKNMGGAYQALAPAAYAPAPPADAGQTGWSSETDSTASDAAAAAHELGLAETDDVVPLPNEQLGQQVHLPELNFVGRPTPGLAYDLSLTAIALLPDQGTPPAPGAPVADPSRKIIKDASLTLEVDDTTAALGRIDTLAVQSGGYILETLSDQGVDSGRPGATVKFAVNVDSFEAALGRLRAIGTVAKEQSSGVDVTTEFTDIQSRIANLEATQARVREFLAQAKTVEEALSVNARLTEIEGQLAELKGRSTYLAGRAAYSTITVTLIGPALPTRTPTITPTLAPTATPTPGTPWSPAPIARDAFATLGGLMKGLAAVAIWLVVVGLPIAVIVGAGWWGVRALLRRGQ